MRGESGTEHDDEKCAGFPTTACQSSYVSHPVRLNIPAGKQKYKKIPQCYFAGCSARSCLASSSAMTQYAVTSTGLSSIHFFSPAQLPSGFCSEASLLISSTRQSCVAPL